MKGWERKVIGQTVRGYPPGWVGVWHHACDVLLGRPCRFMQDVAFSLWVKGDGAVAHGHMQADVIGAARKVKP